MMRLYVVVEGQTEEEFVKRVLGPHLQARHIYTTPIIVTTRRDRLTGKKLGKGGGHWKHWLKDLRRLLGEHTGNNVAFTTLFDLYGLPEDFPQLAALSQNADTLQRAVGLEQEMAATLDDRRLIPYLQRHEFEALVLASLDALGALLDTEDDVLGLEQLRVELAHLAPEDVNDGPDSAPSKRLESRIPSYDKTLHGPLAVEAARLANIRAVCPRFNAWVTKLEGLSADGLAKVIA
jgi:hypothetical protein